MYIRSDQRERNAENVELGSFLGGAINSNKLADENDSARRPRAIGSAESGGDRLLLQK